MNQLAALLALAAVPAAAQVSAPWPVAAEGRACTASMPTPDGESGRLSVSYDAARQEVVLTSLNHVQSVPSDAGAIDLNLVFLDNGREKYDDQWAKRRFEYQRHGEQVQFTTRFAGKANSAQILKDLATAKRVGFLEKSGGRPVVAYFLDGLAPALPQLRECAARAATAS